MKRTSQTLEIFSVSVPDVQDSKKEKLYYFTSAERPVSFDGQQYIPLSQADAAKWLQSELK